MRSTVPLHPAPSTTKLLIADDRLVVREGLKRIVAECSDMKVVGEAATHDEVLEHAQAAEPDVVLLDNMDVETMRSAVDLARHEAQGTLIEASGNIGTNPTRLAAVAATGVDFISLGALTHSSPNFDVSLEFA